MCLAALRGLKWGYPSTSTGVKHVLRVVMTQCWRLIGINKLNMKVSTRLFS